MSDSPKLWPYSNMAAILLAPVIWLVLAIVLYFSVQVMGWPDQESRKLVNMAVVAAGFVPLLLVLLDFLSRSGAILAYKGFKLDFSRVDLSRSEVRQESFGLPDNIGVSGPIVSDTSPMDIIETLKQATKHEIVVIDMREGDAWWVTRLLALSAGAVRADSTKALVFAGKWENRDHQFLGWSRPRDVLDAVLRSNSEYKRRYQRAMRIAQQVFMYGFNEFVPPGFALHADIQRYTTIHEFAELGEAVAEQILMDQLATSTAPGGSLEEDPEHLTVGRLNDLFGHCLYRDAIDLGWPNEEQIAKLMESKAPYVALVRGGTYESVLRREDGERLITREVVKQLQLSPKR